MFITLQYSCFITIFLALFAYYRYLTHKYLKDIKNYSIVYVSSTIPIIPATIYTYILSDYLISRTTTSIIMYYCIEWSISTSLLLISLTTILTINMNIYSIISILCIGMNYFGYLSYIFYMNTQNTVSYICFLVGCFLYIFAASILYYIYKTGFRPIESQNQYEQIHKLKLYKTLMLFVFISWMGYPIIFMLYILNNLSIEYTLLLFNCLDLISKGFFSFVSIGYEINKVDNTFFISRFTRRAIQIAPEFPSVAVEPGEPEYSLTDIPKITEIFTTK